MASGMPTDAVLFSQQQERGVRAVMEKARRQQGMQPSMSELSSSMDSLAMTESSIKKVHIGGPGEQWGEEGRGRECGGE